MAGRRPLLDRLGRGAIACEYTVSVELLPGLRRSLDFRLKVQEPFLVEKAPVVF
jgi:hypothetical protein